MSEIKYTSLGSHDVIRPGDEFLLGSEWRNHSESTYGHRVGHNTSRRPIRQTHQTAYEEVPGSRTTQETITDPQRERIAYEELRPGDRIQPGDEWKNGDGRWQPYVCLTGLLQFVQDGHAARRPIGTTQPAVEQTQRERIAYEELQVGDIIQEGDEWQNECGRWRPFLVLNGSRVQVRQSQRVRRPYNIATMQHERDELKTALCESRAAHEVTVKQGRAACKERDEALAELAQAREASQQLLKTITDNADQFANTGKILEKERDEAQAELRRVQEVVRNLYDEPTARQVQQMLRTWVTELDWSAGCFDSSGREQIDTIQKTLVAVIERIEGMVNPEGGTDGE